jgi:hypothetical protein
MCGEREDSLTAATRSGPASRSAMSETSELTPTMRLGPSATEAGVASADVSPAASPADPLAAGVQAASARVASATVAMGARVRNRSRRGASGRELTGSGWVVVVRVGVD